MAKIEGDAPRKRVRLEEGEGRPRGRPPGSMSKLAHMAREEARNTGALPHELLLQWGRGEPMSRKVPGPDSNPQDPSTWVVEYIPIEEDKMVDCAKSAAPYYAPKISTVEVISGVSDADLDEFIARAATEAGLSVGAVGEGAQDTRTDTDDE